VTKRQILRCCAVQFAQGDVLHWWHNLPRSGGGLRGMRTRYSDDLLWLPFTLCEYLEQTGTIPFWRLRYPT
jgi:cyclic beta-1,2-glucan synthetase